MAKISARIFAKSLGFSTGIEVIIPHNPYNHTPVEKVLYLLHGLSDDCTAWTRRTTIELFAEKYNYAVIMPEVQCSFYANMAYGSNYFTYVSEELPKICEDIFRINHTREKTFVAGLSMGGYGAVRCGLAKPDFFGACAGFSGALDPQARSKDLVEKHGFERQLIGILGQDKIFPEDANLFKLAEKTALLPEGQKPRVLITCGDKDYLLEDNERFNEHMKKLPIDYKYMIWEGEHNWKFWEESLTPMFKFFEKEE